MCACVIDGGGLAILQQFLIVQEPLRGAVKAPLRLTHIQLSLESWYTDAGTGTILIPLFFLTITAGHLALCCISTWCWGDLALMSWKLVLFFSKSHLWGQQLLDLTVGLGISLHCYLAPCLVYRHPRLMYFFLSLIYF